MRSSIFLLSAGVSMALAGPLDKRVLEIVTETEVVYYTVTAETTTSAAPTPAADFEPPAQLFKETTTTEAPVVVVETTVTAGPTTTAAPVATTAEAAAAEPTTTVSAAAAAATPTDFASTAVYHHNLHRANHSAPDMVWEDTYAGYAATVAASCKFAHDLSEGDGNYGQNIAMWASSDDAESLGAEKAIAQAITNMWYDGELDLYPSTGYGQANPDFTNFEAWGHYSQVVWVGSTQIGCDAHYCAPGTMEPDMGAWFSVCNYYPAGNMGGEYGVNVLKPLGHGTVTA